MKKIVAVPSELQCHTKSFRRNSWIFQIEYNRNFVLHLRWSEILTFFLSNATSATYYNYPFVELQSYNITQTQTLTFAGKINVCRASCVDYVSFPPGGSADVWPCRWLRKPVFSNRGFVWIPPPARLPSPNTIWAKTCCCGSGGWCFGTLLKVVLLLFW